MIPGGTMTGKAGYTGIAIASNGAVMRTAGDSASIGTGMEVVAAAGFEDGAAGRISIGLNVVGVEGPDGAIRGGDAIT
jgi:hypothetical protein